MDYVQMFLAHPLGSATATGLTGALVVDLTTFMKSEGPRDFFSKFSFRVAVWKWLQGAVGGFFGGLGISVAV